jgi:2-oxopent-4-enoate/cis-2-oxohex-4-enoate hydratase
MRQAPARLNEGVCVIRRQSLFDPDTLADELYQALVNRAPVPRLSARYPSMTIEQAYAVQVKLCTYHLSSGIERLIGKKIGVTSKAVMDILGVEEPDFGFLTSAMVRPDGAMISMGDLIAPKAEGEIAFLLKRDLRGPDVSIADVLDATELVFPCIEIVDSRIQDWDIGIQDTIADNASSALFVIGGQARGPTTLDLDLVGMTLEVNGKTVSTGAGAASLGHPAQAVAWLAQTLDRFGMALESGEIILSGSLGAMVPVAAGDNLRISIGQLGSASACFI